MARIAQRSSVRAPRGKGSPDERPPREDLSNREREVLSMLAEGSSGTEIARTLVLSPETVRTHIRNAMSKLGASSRAQAVAIALRQGDLGPSGPPAWTATLDAGQAGSGRTSLAPISAGSADPVFKALLGALVSLHDVEGGANFVVEEGGLTMRRAALAGETGERRGSDRSIRLGEGPVGRAALERTPQLIHGDGPPDAGAGRTAMYAPMAVGGRLLGVISLTTRPSRLTARSELLLLQAFAGQVAEVLVGRPSARGPLLRGALERLRTSWTAGG
jgi:DNA-binding CsgD family transcriptional regulator